VRSRKAAEMFATYGRSLDILIYQVVLFLVTTGVCRKSVCCGHLLFGYTKLPSPSPFGYVM
jgi:hypothetical protein